MQVGLDGRYRDEQLAGDIGVALSLHDFQDDLPLALRDGVFCQEVFEHLVDLDRGGNEVIQEIDDHKNAVQDVGNGAVEKGAVHGEQHRRAAYVTPDAKQGLDVTEGGKDQESQHEGALLGLPDAV